MWLQILAHLSLVLAHTRKQIGRTSSTSAKGNNSLKHWYYFTRLANSLPSLSMQCQLSNSLRVLQKASTSTCLLTRTWFLLENWPNKNMYKPYRYMKVNTYWSIIGKWSASLMRTHFETNDLHRSKVDIMLAWLWKMSYIITNWTEWSSLWLFITCIIFNGAPHCPLEAKVRRRSLSHVRSYCILNDVQL